MANQYTERENERYGRRSEGGRGWGQGYEERGYEGRAYEDRGRFERRGGESRSFSGDEGRERWRGSEDIAESCSGVKEVQNQLRVQQDDSATRSEQQS